MTDNLPATATPTALPALYARVNPQHDTIVPMVLLQQDLSELVKARQTRPGDVVLALDSADTGAKWLINRDPDDPKPSFTAYVLGSERFVIHAPKGEDITYLPNDYERGPNDRDVWVGFRYYMYIPEYNSVARVRLVKTAGMHTYRKINFFIEQAAMEGNFQPVNVKFTTLVKRGGGGHEYYVLEPQRIQPDEGLAAALEHQARLSTYAVESDTEDGPAVDAPRPF